MTSRKEMIKGIMDLFGIRETGIPRTAGPATPAPPSELADLIDRFTHGDLVLSEDDILALASWAIPRGSVLAAVRLGFESGRWQEFVLLSHPDRGTGIVDVTRLVCAVAHLVEGGGYLIPGVTCSATDHTLRLVHTDPDSSDPTSVMQFASRLSTVLHNSSSEVAVRVIYHR